MMERLSVTGIHRFPSARMALAEQAERIANRLERRPPSSTPPPCEDDLAEADTLDVEPDPPEPTPLAA